VVGYPGAIIHTSDGGKSWSEQKSGITQVLKSVFFTDSLMGCAVGGEGVIVYTHNGGVTWIVGKSETYSDLKSVCFTDSNNGWAVGSKGTIVHTSDGGETWRKQKSGTETDLVSVSFVNSKTGWVVAPHHFSCDKLEAVEIYRTTDGGATWVNLPQTHLHPNEARINPEALQFIDSKTGWVVGSIGKILKTTDGGNTFVDLT